mgnify:CR=1 FL=1
MQMKGSQKVGCMIKKTGLKDREKTNCIQIVRTNTTQDVDLSKHDLNKQELEKGNLGIGNHFVIKLDGTIEKGRDINKIGSGRDDAISLCIVGGLNENKEEDKNYTEKQRVSFGKIIDFVYKTYGVNEVV